MGRTLVHKPRDAWHGARPDREMPAGLVALASRYVAAQEKASARRNGDDEPSGGDQRLAVQVSSLWTA